MTGKRFGFIAYADGVYHVQAAPQVAMRLKRIFPRARSWVAGQIELADTTETSRDLEWVMERWPFTVSVDAAERIAARAQQHRDAEDYVQQVLDGYAAPSDFRDPVREPRSYQYAPAQITLTTGGLLLTDELGLGKTFSSIMLLRHPEALPAMIAVPTHLQHQWVREIALTLPWLTSHIITTGSPYDLAARNNGWQPDVLITTYFKLNGWAETLAGVVRTTIFDEVQELRRSGSQKYDAARAIAGAAVYRMGLSATPVYNYGGELWNIMNVLAPDQLGTADEFAREWCGGAWLDGKAKVNEPEALVSYLRDAGLMLRRSRTEVGRELPEVQRVTQMVDIDEEKLAELSEDAVAYAAALLADDSTNTERWQAAGDFDWRLRQATGISKAPMVAQFVNMLLESGEPVVLWGWHRSVYDIWLEKLKDWQPALYTGSELPNQKNEAAARFLDGRTNLLIMSLRAGAGLDGLQERCSVGVFGELDWSPGMHDQCIGRLHRDGQANSVLAYFLVAESGSDPAIVDVLTDKRMQSTPINDPDAVILGQQVDKADRVRELARSFLASRGVDPNTAAPPPGTGGDVLQLFP